MTLFAPREAATGIACPACGQALNIKRSCHEVYMLCPACHKRFPLNDFISQADEAMERFLENVYCDRI